MKTPQDLLGSISGGRVLDVATGSGGFVAFLLEGLKDYTEIIGIDQAPRAAALFAGAFQDHPAVRFAPMDALNLAFPDASFDTVCISNSLHHFDHPETVLSEMARVLRPGGHFILSEMYQDGQSETQMTHVLLHHWWAAVDRACGVVHHDTYRRQELLDLLAAWPDRVVEDLADNSDDPKAPQLKAELEPVFERYLQRAAGHPELLAQGAQLRRRVEEIGFHPATTLMVLAVKPA